jgi:hypothetical protein
MFPTAFRRPFPGITGRPTATSDTISALIFFLPCDTMQLAAAGLNNRTKVFLHLQWVTGLWQASWPATPYGKIYVQVLTNRHVMQVRVCYATWSDGS